MPTVSVIIPTLDEARAIGATLAHVRTLAPEAERIVADGGSADGTPALARPQARVLATPRGRARQMNAGAREATGEWLLFLHADTRLPEGCFAEIDRAAARGCAAGAFRLRIAGRHPLLPLLGWGATWRTRLTGIALGDQALFVRRETFEHLGGFPDLPLMEDYAFARRLRAAGVRLCLARSAVVTSGRRWDALGFWRVWWTMRRQYRRFDRHGPTALTRAGRDYPDVR